MSARASGNATPLGFVGCGAIVEQFYLPSLRGCQGVSCEILVDHDLARVAPLAEKYGIPRVAASLEEIPRSVQGLVLGVPNDLHAPVASDAVQRGFHVLCEKPLARNVAEVAAMVQAARASQRGLFAAMVARRYPPLREVVRHRLQRLVGPLVEIDASYGFPLDWPVKSAAYYDKTRSGGGALLDFGVHLVDALLYTLGSPSFEVLSYADDADGGVEAEAEGRVAFSLADGIVEGTVRASRLRRLPNALILKGVNGALSIPMDTAEPATLTVGTGVWPVTHHIADRLPCFTEQLEDFGRAIRGESHDMADGCSQTASVGMIEQMYARRTRLAFVWD